MSTAHGFIIVNKPRGATSFSIVALVRRLTGVRRVGHAGTLDPLASGVLPVAVGRATRLIEYLDDAHKTYMARVRFGFETDTYDAEGQVTAMADASTLTRGSLEAALGAFVGEVEQAPPAYSAIKVAGKPLYRYARAGEEVALAPRKVRIESIALRAFDADVAELEVRCGKGTYIRSLAHDLGRALGCGAHLTALERTASGGFTLSDAHTRAELESYAGAGRLSELMLAPDRAVERRDAAILDSEQASDVASGRDIELRLWNGQQYVSTTALCRAYSADGLFLGMLEAAAGARWHPIKVFPEA